MSQSQSQNNLTEEEGLKLLQQDELRKKMEQYLNNYHIDATTGMQFITRNKHISTNELYKHLLKYTYAATEREVNNHREVTKILREIRDSLIKRVNPNGVGSA
jgi:hypothetical protein